MRALLWAFLFLSLVSNAAATTYLIRPDGTGDYPDLASAIAGAADHDIIELADGIFTGPENRELGFYGKALTVRSQNGDPAHCILDCGGAARGFYFRTGEGPDAVVEGITITNGATESGGAVHLSSSSPTFINCVFTGCTSEIGGAIYT